MIPQDDFTPYGYLDNPYHSWKINPSGVLRSQEPLGMGWHVPNLGSYVHNQFQYTAHLTIGLRIGDMVLVTPEDFRRNRCMISSSLHTKNRFEYRCVVPAYGLTLTARYFLVHEDALGCMLSLSSTSRQAVPVTCYVIHLHTHNPHTSRLWEHGLYARQDRENGFAMLGIASEGDVFIAGARAADGTRLTLDEMGYMVSLDEVAAWAYGQNIPRPGVTQREEKTGWQVRAVALPCRLTVGGEGTTSEAVRLNAVLARGVSLDQSYIHWEDGMEEIARAEVDHRADDEAFWNGAPQLSGDWPEHWRRGFVYDLETLRMTIRPPVGVIAHPWDGMQVQAPRTVLAEAAMDCLFLSYAHPQLAAEVLLGHFESAPHENLPCMREDGSYNMLADDGQICGTAPEWGFPLWCCDSILRRTGDLHWLGRLYPKAAAYLRWWLEHRCDPEGWLVYACSWESGQDVSSRFGPQQTGGTIIQHVRPVDLQASMAQGAAILARWSMLLAEIQTGEGDTYNEEAEWWRKVASDFTEKTRLMWRDGWFRDYDAVAGEWSTQRDAMHLVPIFCDAADWGQVEQLRHVLAQPPQHSSGWAPLSWPPVVMTLVGAADAARMHAEAAELAFRFIDASYRSIDRRELDEYGGLPGVTREYRRTVEVKFGFDYANAGIEGYGWGALSVHLLMRYVLGLQEVEADRLMVRPVLPQALRRKGATYKVGPVQWGKYGLSVECMVKDARRYRVRLRCVVAVKEMGEDGEMLEGEQKDVVGQAMEEYEGEWEGEWGEGRMVQLPGLVIVSN